MKPFPSQTPTIFPLSPSFLIPRDDAKGEEFPIDGADNGAAKTQRPSRRLEMTSRLGCGGVRVSLIGGNYAKMWDSLLSSALNPPPPRPKRHETLTPSSLAGYRWLRLSNRACFPSISIDRPEPICLMMIDLLTDRATGIKQWYLTTRTWTTRLFRPWTRTAVTVQYLSLLIIPLRCLWEVSEIVLFWSFVDLGRMTRSYCSLWDECNS